MVETMLLQDDLQSRKENDIDSLVGINGKIKQLGSKINAFLEVNNEPWNNDEEKNDALIPELLTLFETLTQELDEIT